jgi:hypothetical protein
MAENHGDKTMADRIFGSWLKRQHQEAMDLASNSDILRLRPLGGSAPQLYIATYLANGLVKAPNGAILVANRFDVGIALHDGYLRHVEPAQVLSYLGPHQNPWHPNIRPPFMCLTLYPGTPLVDILFACYELLTFRLYYTGDEGLNHAASQWARHQDPSRFPTDPRPLKWRDPGRSPGLVEAAKDGGRP